VHYVSPGGTHTPPYTNWLTAATNIQSAIDAATSSGSVVRVADGTYLPGATVEIGDPIILESVNGPEATIIDGGNLIPCVSLDDRYGKIRGFTITRGASPWNGGGIACGFQGGTIENCHIISNFANSGGGVCLDSYNARLRNSIVKGNRSTNPGGGIRIDYNGWVDNCIIADNASDYGDGGGVFFSANFGCLRGSLITGCSASNGNGGGVYITEYADVGNCTVADNFATSGGGIYAPGFGEIKNSIIRFNDTSSGWSNYYVSGNVYMTYCNTIPEPYAEGTVTGDPRFVDPANGDYRIRRDSPCIDVGTNRTWMGSEKDLGGDPRIADGIVDMGAYELFATTNFVSLDGAHVYPFTNWATAATSIQAAIDVASYGDIVLVSNGVYSIGDTIHIEKGITVGGVSGREYSTIDGGDARRCVYVNDPDAFLEGFTILNGMSWTAGGGVRCDEKGGTVRDCRITGNWSPMGAGAYLYNNFGRLDKCEISNNSSSGAGATGGGIYFAYGGVVERCLVVSNETTTGDGGGIYIGSYSGTVKNSLVARNKAPLGSGGGFYIWGSGLVESCTIVSNEAMYGGGLYGRQWGTVRNNIIYDNVASSGPEYINYSGYLSFSHCCTAPQVSGTGNITNDPAFIDRASGDFRLLPNSPCTDAGEDQPWMIESSDLAGNPRISYACVDMGCYEHPFPFYYVSLTGSNIHPYSSWENAATGIADAVDAAVDYSVVLVSNGTYVLDRTVYVTNGIAVKGAANGETPVVDGRYAMSCFHMDHVNASVEGFTVSKGWNTFGGGVYMTAGEVRECTIVSNLAHSGGAGVYMSASGCVTRCEFIGNSSTGDQVTASHGGGLSSLGGRVNDCEFIGNSANLGGAVLAAGDSLIENCDLFNNSAGYYGGGLYFSTGGTATGCLFSGNSANYGAGAYMSEGGELMHSDVITNVAAERGGGIYLFGGGNVTNCLVSGNTAPGGYGGGAYIDGTGTLSGCLVISNSSAHGGGLYVSGSNARVRDSSLVTNTASLYGGGLYGTGGYVEFCSISSNVAEYGGGAFLNGAPVLSNCLVSANSCAMSGGGVYCYSSGELLKCVIRENRAAVHGGGAYVYLAGALRMCDIAGNTTADNGGGAFCDAGGSLTNCLIRGNDAENGGGLFLYQGGNGRNSTIVSNTAYIYGGGVYCSDGGDIVNSIIYFNSAGFGWDNYADSGSGGAYRYVCTAPAIADEGNITNAPSFRNEDIGDYHLLWGSAGIDAGEANGSPDLDLDGTDRPIDGDLNSSALFDMGAFEYNPASCDSDGDGLSDAEEVQVHGTSPVVRDSDADTQTDGDEVTAGTSPTNSGNYFCVESLNVDDLSGGAVLSWQSVTQRLYTVRAAPGLIPPAWADVPDAVDLPGTGGAMSFTNPPPAFGAAFYHLRVRLGP